MKIRIFRAGNHTDSSGENRTFSPNDIFEIARNYNVSNHEAPIVIGHPQTDDPAWGWVKALSTENDELYATVDQVPAEFKSLVNQGRFKKVSAAFYTPDDPINPTPGKFYLRHIGFLGAQPPALKGLGSVNFKESTQNYVEIMTNEVTQEIENSQDKEKMLKWEQQLAQKASDLELLEKRLAAAKSKNERMARRNRYASHLQFLESQKGKILPSQHRQIAEFMLSLDTGSFKFSEFMFAEMPKSDEAPSEDTPSEDMPAEEEMTSEKPDIQAIQTEWFKSQLAWFQNFIKSLPEQVEFREVSKPSKSVTAEVVPLSPLEKKIAAWKETLPKRG